MTDYYIKNGGSDGDTGLDDDNAWENFNKVKDEFNANAVPGDIYSFKSPDEFVSSGFGLSNITDFSANPVVFDSYNGGMSKQVVDAANRRIYNFGANANGITVQNQYFENSPAQTGTNTYGIYFSGSAQNGLFQDNIYNTFKFGIDVYQASEGVNPSNVQVLNSEFYNCQFAGVFGGADDLVITGNTYDNCGYGRAVYDHAIYFTGYDIINNTISYNRMFNTAHITDGCDSAVIVGHGRLTNVTVNNNWTWEVANTVYKNAYGIAWAPGEGAIEEWCKGISIEHNFVYSFGGNGLWVRGGDDTVMNKNIVVQTGIQDLAQFYGMNVEQNTDAYQVTNATVTNNLIYWDTTKGLTISGTAGSGVNIDPTIGGTLIEDNNVVIPFVPPLNCMLTSYPAKGKITALGVDGSFTYEYEGGQAEDTDSFTFMIFDTNGQSNEETVSITITAGTVTYELMFDRAANKYASLSGGDQAFEIGDTIEFDFSANADNAFTKAFFGATSSFEMQARYANGTITLSRHTATIDGNEVLSAGDISAYINTGFHHYIATATESNRYIGHIGNNRDLNKGFDGIIKNFKVTKGELVTQWDISSGNVSGTPESPSVDANGFGNIDFVNVVAEDWTLV